MRALVLGGSGFIGSALIKRLKADGYWVRSVDLRMCPFGRNHADQVMEWDLRKPIEDWLATGPQGEQFDEVYQLAADVGGVAYLSGGNDADVMANNVAINRNVAQWPWAGVVVFASSACVYPPLLPPPYSEGAAFADVPANDYGVEKLFSERLYQAQARERCLRVRIARLGNVYGPGEPLEGQRAHMVGHLCRKAVTAPCGPLQVWGDGRQVRSMVFVDDAVDGLIKLARSGTDSCPVNIAGPPASVAQVAEIIGDASGRSVEFESGPTGVASSALDVNKARSVLGWTAKTPLSDGLRATYSWAFGRA